MEVNAGKMLCIVMSQDENAGQSQNIKIDDKSFERVVVFKYLGKTLRNKNSIHEEIKSRLKPGNDHCHLVQNLLTFGLPSKNIKIKIHRTIILPVVLCGYETWFLTFREECRLRVLENGC
jgi:hypothetical protein